jgi:hypothetical protein
VAIGSITEQIKAAEKIADVEVGTGGSACLSRLGTPVKGGEKGDKEMATPEASKRQG